MAISGVAPGTPRGTLRGMTSDTPQPGPSLDYAEGGGCRWQALLTYFEDDALMAGPCHHCDNDPAVPDETARLTALRMSVQALAAGR